MRIIRELHEPLFCQYSCHDFSEKLQRIDSILQNAREVFESAANDLGVRPSSACGARGMSVESVVRAGILMRLNGWTYRELSFHLSDSISARAFVYWRVAV